MVIVYIQSENSICRRSKCTGGIGIFLLADDIASIIVFPCPGFASLAVVFPDQLVRTVVGVLEKEGLEV